MKKEHIDKYNKFVSEAPMGSCWILKGSRQPYRVIDHAQGDRTGYMTARLEHIGEIPPGTSVKHITVSLEKLYTNYNRTTKTKWDNNTKQPAESN